jgi:hypothetical protein
MKHRIRSSAHARVRQAQRNLSAQDIDFVATHGWPVHSGGALHVFLRRRDIPSDKSIYRRFARLEGTTLVIRQEGEVAVLITAYRNRNGLKAIRTKAKHNNSFRFRPRVSHHAPAR